MQKKGFTLLEILIVVVICISIAAFAVPAFKKTQEKARFNAAAGALVQLGNAVKNLRLDLDMEGTNTTFPLSTDYVSLSADWSDPSNSTFTTVANATKLADIATSNDNLGYALVARGYMPQFPSTTNTFNGYTYYICPATGSGSTQTCCSSTSVIACMTNTDSLVYRYGKFMENGSVVAAEGTSSGSTGCPI